MSQGLQTQAKPMQKPSAKKAKEKRLQPEPSRLFAGECSACRKEKGVLQRASHGPATNTVPPIVHEVLRSPGQPLEGKARSFMEPRFRRDFSMVRIHTDAKASESARAVNAMAYTVGRDVVFSNKYDTQKGGPNRHLLAHELTHVVQQDRSSSPVLSFGIEGSRQHEHEAQQAAKAIDSGRSVNSITQASGMGLSRFSDTGHHVIEEAGLGGAGFDPRQIEAVERGNLQRDYSQVGAVGNFALLCKPRKFGGYQPEEHFDNFIFDAVTNRWRTRAPPGSGTEYLHKDPNKPDRSPIEYIQSELFAIADSGMSESKRDSLVHLGNAFHTVEDFFSHSNFVELINKESTFGEKLVTGSYAGESANERASLSHTLGAVSGSPMREHYEQQAGAATSLTEPRSHSRIAKDMPESHNYNLARRLAALVIQDLGVDVMAAMRQPTTQQRRQLISETVIAKIQRYLRPPNLENDRWWEQLTARDAGAIDKRLEEASQRKPVTINQCMFSPLRNIEASSSSSWRLPIGVALPVQVGSNQIWIQAGLGVPSQPLPLDRSLSGEQKGGIEGSFIGGIQITGRFQ